MNKIIYEEKGKNYQVPGLPYESVYTHVHSVVLDSIEDVDTLKEILKKAEPNTLLNPLSVDVVRGYQDYIPSTFKRITQHMPIEMQQQYFGIDDKWIPEHEKVLMQLQTEIEAKSATLDAAIIHARRDLGTVVNKAHVINRLYMIGSLYNHLKPRDYPFLFGDLTDPKTWDSSLTDMKMMAIDYLLEVPVGKRKYPERTRQVEVSKKELATKYGYIEWLKRTLGDNLIGVLLYGSAARTDDPAKYSDFDNWVRVKDIRKAHEVLKGTSPAYLDGKVYTIKDGHYPEGAKHLGLHIFPESEEYLKRYIRFLHDSREFLKHTSVLHGEFPFVKVRQDEVIERGVSQAYIKLKTIAGSLNWAYSSPERIMGKPALFEFIVKNLRFFLQHSLNAMGEPKFRDKEELNQLLADRGLYIPAYKSDVKHIQDSLAYAMVAVLKLQKDLIDSGKRPNLEFLTDGKQYHEWNAKNIDDWGRVDDG